VARPSPRRSYRAPCPNRKDSSPMKPSALHLLRQADEHCSAALGARDPYERTLRLRQAQRSTLQALALILGPCGIRAASQAPALEDGDRVTLVCPDVSPACGMGVSS